MPFGLPIEAGLPYAEAMNSSHWVRPLLETPFTGLFRQTASIIPTPSVLRNLSAQPSLRRSGAACLVGKNAVGCLGSIRRKDEMAVISLASKIEPEFQARVC